MFALRGFHGILADDIAEEAGVSVGSFYAYFKDKRDLFYINLDRAVAQTTAVLSEWSLCVTNSDRFDLGGVIRQALETLVLSHQSSSALFSEASQMARYDETIRKRLAANDMVVRRLFEKMLLEVNASLDRQTVKTTAYVLYHAAEGVIHEIVHTPEKDLDKDEIIAELSRLLTGYLQSVSSA